MTVIRRSKWPGGGSRSRSQRATEPALVLLLVQRHQPGADVVDVDLLPVELSRPGREILLDVAQELVEQDLVRLELRRAGRCGSGNRRSPLARRAGSSRLELAPGAEDLVELLGLPAVLIAVRVLALA